MQSIRTPFSRKCLWRKLYSAGGAHCGKIYKQLISLSKQNVSPFVAINKVTKFRQMENLINELIQKAGLSPEMAQKATSVVLDYVNNNLPDSLKGKGESLLSGNFDVKSLLGDNAGGDGLLDKVKGMFS
jgi:hypothetical protein